MLQNAIATAFTVFELLRENQKEGQNYAAPPPPPLPPTYIMVKLQPNVFNRCNDLLMTPMILSDIAILNIKGLNIAVLLA